MIVTIGSSGQLINITEQSDLNDYNYGDNTPRKKCGDLPYIV